MNKINKALKSVRGVNAFGFGMSFVPSEGEKEKVKNIIEYLEDRRVLFAPYEKENPLWVKESIIDIREMIRSEITGIERNSMLYVSLKIMQMACRRYLDRISSINKDDDVEMLLVDCLSEIRTVFGLELMKIAYNFKFDLSEELSRIIPIENDD